MEPTNRMVQAIQGSQKVWHQLRDDWSRLGMPGSAYSPGEFVACLLLSELVTDGDEIEQIQRRISRGGELYKRLVAMQLLPDVFHDAEAAAILSVATFYETVTSSPEPQLSEQPAVEIPLLTSCPHCDHEFERCAAGAYKVASVVEPVEVKVDETAAPEPQVVSGCIHVGNDGKCTACTRDEVEVCCEATCQEDVIVSKVHACKDPDCTNVYCNDHEDELNEHGYCNDCDTLDCDGDNCSNQIDNGTEHRCSNPGCEQNEGFCDDCAARLLNAKGECAACSKEEESDCSDCGNTVTQSRLTVCSNPDCMEKPGYCPGCKKKNLDRRGRCDDCK